MDKAAHELQVCMLGDFAFSFDGENLPLGRNAGAKFSSFLQMLILSGDNGLSRQEIVDALFTDENLANITNSLNNLVYQTRLQLKKARPANGLTAEGFPVIGIRKVRDRYFWQSEPPVCTDIRKFRNTLASAGDDPAQLTKAIAIYRGDLLPGITGNAMVESERERLRNDYADALDKLAEHYVQAADSDALCQLYTRALTVTASRDGDLESALILKLLAAGDTRNALKQYDRALSIYQSQGRGRIPSRLEECAAKLTSTGMSGEASSLHSQLMDVLAVDASENSEDRDGAFYCNYPSFIDAVKLRRRNLLRDMRPVTLMLMTLVDYEGKALRMEKKQVLYSQALKDAIRSALRVGDSFTRHDETGFLVLLPGADEENAVTIFNRISRRFKEKAGSNAAVRYRMLSLNALG